MSHPDIQSDPQPDPHSAARHLMLDQQLRPRGIRSQAVLAALAAIPRHRFVPPDLAPRAYEDAALPVAEGQTISQPYIVAYMTESLRLQPHHRVLEIGTGTGYQTAVLAALVPQGRVYTIERHPALSLAAQSLLASLHFTNISYHIGDGSQGWPAPPHTPPILFDRIITTAAAPTEPTPLLDQLADAGLLLIPLGDANDQTLFAITRHGLTYTRAPLLHCRFVPLLGQHAWDEQTYLAQRHPPEE